MSWNLNDALSCEKLGNSEGSTKIITARICKNKSEWNADIKGSVT